MGGADAAVLAAAYQVDNFIAVVRLDFGVLPFRPRQNIAIPLDGHSIGSHFKVLKQRHNSEAIGNLAKLAVNGNFHAE